MLEKIIIKCQYKGGERANYNWGSLFHGALFELLPEEAGEYLHQSRLRPFSQYVLPQEGQQLTWNIGIWDGSMAELLAQALLPLSKIELKHKGINLEIMDIQRQRKSKEEYFTKFFISDNNCRRYELQFLTPCTHKRDGRYVLFPSPELIVQSLFMRYCSFSQDISLDDSEVMEQLIDHIAIVRYSLRSAVYYLEKTKITGYTGKVTLSIRGPEQLARLAAAILSFAEYAGIGAKTALGMGGVKVLPLG